MDTYNEAIAWWIERRKAVVEFFNNGGDHANRTHCFGRGVTTQSAGRR